MVIDHAPVMSVVVEYRLPVRVFCAVTVTPGSGVLPLFTAPCSLPPVTVSAGFARLPEAVADDGGVGVGSGTAVCPHAKMPATKTLAATVHRVAARRIDSPWGFRALT